MNRPTFVVLDTAARVSKAVAYSAVVGLVGAATGIATGAVMGLSSGLRLASPTTDDPEVAAAEKKLRSRKRLIQNVRTYEMYRGVLDMLSPIISSAEFNARRRLEAMGYYPCAQCGIPHIQPEDQNNCMPKGAYWSEDLQRYVHPGHPDWSREEYEAATNQPWAEEGDDEGPLH